MESAAPDQFKKGHLYRDGRRLLENGIPFCLLNEDRSIASFTIEDKEELLTSLQNERIKHLALITGETNYQSFGIDQSIKDDFLSLLPKETREKLIISDTEVGTFLIYRYSIAHRLDSKKIAKSENGDILIRTHGVNSQVPLSAEACDALLSNNAPWLHPNALEVMTNAGEKFDKRPWDFDLEVNNARWQKYLVTKQPKDVPPLIKIGSSPVVTPSNHSLIIGKKKSRKTLFLIWLIVEYISQGGKIEDVLICDTEQGEQHVWKARDKIYKLTKQYVNILSLRGLGPKDRREVIQEAIDDGRYKIVVIDGIRDLLSNINDPDQCTELVTWIEHLTVSYGIHIINVLHQNKVDTNARGHIGSELTNKAEVTIDLERDEKAECTIVKCESSRDIPFESFAFTHDEEGLPKKVSMPVKGQSLSDPEVKQRLKYVFDGKHIGYKDVVEGIKQHFEVGVNKAGQMLGRFVRDGWIIKNGADKSPSTVYKLMVNG